MPGNGWPRDRCRSKKSRPGRGCWERSRPGQGCSRLCRVAGPDDLARRRDCAGFFPWGDLRTRTPLPIRLEAPRMARDLAGRRPTDRARWHPVLPATDRRIAELQSFLDGGAASRNDVTSARDHLPRWQPQHLGRRSERSQWLGCRQWLRWSQWPSWQQRPGWRRGQWPGQWRGQRQCRRGRKLRGQWAGPWQRVCRTRRTTDWTRQHAVWSSRRLRARHYAVRLCRPPGRTWREPGRIDCRADPIGSPPAGGVVRPLLGRRRPPPVPCGVSVE